MSDKWECYVYQSNGFTSHFTHDLITFNPLDKIDPMFDEVIVLSDNEVLFFVKFNQSMTRYKRVMDE